MKYKITELIDLKKIQVVIENFCKASGIASAIIDLDGKVIISSRWQKICTDFFRVNPQTLSKCIESDTVLANKLLVGQKYVIYKCRNGLVDAAAPIIIEGEHMANLFIGQILFNPPDINFFQKQAQKYGFDQASYLKALSEVPVLSEDLFRSMLDFVSGFAELLGEMGLQQIRQAEATVALRESESKYKHLYSMVRLMCDNFPDLIWTKDLESKFIFANKACCEKLLNAKNTDEPIGKTDMFFAEREKKSHPDNPDYHTFGETCRDSDLVVLKTKKAQRSDESGNIKGKFVFLDVYKAPFKDEKGNLIGTVGCAREVTKEKKLEKERKQAEEELKKHRKHLEELVKERTKRIEDSQQALTYLIEDANESRIELNIINNKLNTTNKELESFSYSVSHDLRAPLRSVDGFSKILLEDYHDALDKQGKHYLQRIRAGTQKMGQLIDDLLNLSRIGRQPLNKKTTNLKTIANEAYKLLESERKNRKVKFTVHECPETLADPNLMQNVFSNLLSNALKFTKNKPLTEIEFGYKEKDNKTIFFIKDNGVGFDMKFADKLFSPFQRLHTNEEYEGSGIGLAIVQRIIFKHGGQIWVESEPDKGTTFYFMLNG
ncbi:MAG: PocR ligand-binding domain-containing protein [Bacteroidales bacterium]|nr:PocR ligand-binding domain-containing protein [Bacteroidales bacterium]